VSPRESINRDLFDVEDVVRTPHVRDMIVAGVTPDDVDEFSHRYHYTDTGGSRLWRWGLWSGATLHGIVSYNLPTRDVCEAMFGEEGGHDHVWHMGRLALADRSPLNAESRLIGGSLREIRRLFPDVWGIVTYAATEVGHLGYVYQATNALYTGLAGDPWYFVDARGGRHSTYLSGHVDVERGESLGWTRHRGGGKHRYVYLLGSRTQLRQRRALLRFPVLPYPKEGDG
jgi:hypothetical protein